MNSQRVFGKDILENPNISSSHRFQFYIKMKAYTIIYEDLFCKIEECWILFHVFSNQTAIFSYHCIHVQHP